MQPELQALLNKYNALDKSDRYVFQKLIQFLDGRNIQLGKTTGTMIGTAANQKLGLYGMAPTTQHGAIGTPSGGTTVDSQARTAITSIITALATIGIIA